MANAFDFELVANDQVTATIHRIDESVKNLIPKLDKTQNSLKLGGHESIEGLDNLNIRLKGMGRLAREGVQFIGDLVPPLKMVGEIGANALKLGAIGAMGYTAVNIAKGLGAAANAAYSLNTAAKNAGMSVNDFSRLSGAMQILGADSDSAKQSVERLYKTFNDPLWARNDNTQALLAQNGLQIARNKDGTANVFKSLENIAQIFPKLLPQNQKTLADALGLDENTLALLREGSRYKELLAKADKFNLTVDPALNAQLTGLDRQLAEVSAAWDGLKLRLQSKIYGAILFDGSVKDGIEGVTDLITHGVDSISLAHFLGFNRGNEADQLRRGYNDPQFYNSLNEWDKVGLDYGMMTSGFRKKYQHYYGRQDEQEKKQAATPVDVSYLSPDDTQQQAKLTQLESTYHLPATLLDRIYQAESGRGKNLLSPKGAEGPFQFMPATGNDYGLNTTQDRMDFDKSSEAAARYLSDLLKMFHGDVNKAVASYNWGQNNVKKYGLGQAPRETQHYLQKIMPGLPAIHLQQNEPAPAERIHQPYVADLLRTFNGDRDNAAAFYHWRQDHVKKYGIAPAPDEARHTLQQSRLELPAIHPQQKGSASPESTHQPSILSTSAHRGHQRVADEPAPIATHEKTEIELTLIDDKTGSRRLIRAQSGAKISVSMMLPG